MTSAPRHVAPPSEPPPDPAAKATRPLPVLPQPQETPADSGPPQWVTVSRPSLREGGDGTVSARRVLLQLVAGVVAVLASVAVLGTLAAGRLAEREAVNDAGRMTDLLATTLVQPVLTDDLASGQPAALAAFDTLVRERMLGPDIARVKLWSPTGTVIYADEPLLVGRVFELDPEQKAALAHPATRANVSDLTQKENEFETGGRLLEVYRPVWTSTGREVLFEIYAPYGPVEDRASQLTRGFLGVIFSALLLLLVLLTPLVWSLTKRLSAAQTQREQLLQHAVDASADERRRIAATLHEGPVQDLVATSYAVSGAALHARTQGREPLGVELDQLAGTVRGTIRVLRTLLVDIYPPSLADAGVGAALSDLAQGVAAKGVDARLDLDADTAASLAPDEERLLFRVAQECLRNAAKHAAPCTATVALHRDGQGRVVLDVLDDGPGFDSARLTQPEHGHFGLRVLRDLTTDAGAHLEVASAPGAGTHWRLVLPEGSS
ncbi:ATP-binding protein [Dermatophilaceae bacterium Soc4.6]